MPIVFVTLMFVINLLGKNITNVTSQNKSPLIKKNNVLFHIGLVLKLIFNMTI